MVPVDKSLLRGSKQTMHHRLVADIASVIRHFAISRSGDKLWGSMIPSEKHEALELQNYSSYDEAQKHSTSNHTKLWIKRYFN